MRGGGGVQGRWGGSGGCGWWPLLGVQLQPYNDRPILPKLLIRLGCGALGGLIILLSLCVCIWRATGHIAPGPAASLPYPLRLLY